MAGNCRATELRAGALSTVLRMSRRQFGWLMGGLKRAIWQVYVRAIAGKSSGERRIFGGDAGKSRGERWLFGGEAGSGEGGGEALYVLAVESLQFKVQGAGVDLGGGRYTFVVYGKHVRTLFGHNLQYLREGTWLVGDFQFELAEATDFEQGAVDDAVEDVYVDVAAGYDGNGAFSL